MNYFYQHQIEKSTQNSPSPVELNISKIIDSLYSNKMTSTQNQILGAFCWLASYYTSPSEFDLLKKHFAFFLKTNHFSDFLSTAQQITLDSSDHIRPLLFGHNPNEVIHSSSQNIKTGFLFVTQTQEDLIVQLYSPQSLIIKGQVYPVGPLNNLTYNSELQLQEHHRHWIQLPLKHSCFFLQRGLSSLLYQIIKGPLFEPGQSEHVPWEKVPLIHSHLRRFESFFVNVDTDPLVLSFVQELHQICHSLERSSLHEGLLAEGAQKVQRIQNQYEELFPTSLKLRRALHQAQLKLRVTHPQRERDKRSFL